MNTNNKSMIERDIDRDLPVCDQPLEVFGCTLKPHAGILKQHAHFLNLLPSLLR